MKEQRWTVILVAVVVGLLLVYSVAFTADYKTIAIVKTFGKAGGPIDGGKTAPGGAGGLHWKYPWPVQSLVEYDRRTFVMDDASEELQTRDKQMLIVTVFCTWRIEDPVLFLRTLETADRGEEQVRKILRDKKGKVISQHDMAEFVNTDPSKMRVADIEEEIRANANSDAEKSYGIQILSVGIKSLWLPETVTQQVVNSMKEERNRYAQDYRTRGEAEADMIRSRANAAKEQILAFARFKAESIRSEGIQEVTKLYETYRKNEQFAMFLRELDFLKEALKNNAVIVLEPSWQHSIGFLKDGPSLPSLDGATPPDAKPAVKK